MSPAVDPAAEQATAEDRGGEPEILASIATALTEGAGLPELTRRVARALDASIIVLDARGLTLAVAARSPAEERSLQGGGGTVESLDLVLAGELVGSLRMRRRSETAGIPAALLLALLAGEVQRVGRPGSNDQAAAAALLATLLERDSFQLQQAGELLRQLGVEIAGGASLIFVRAHPQSAVEEGWRERVRTLAERASRGLDTACICALLERPEAGNAAAEVLLLVPGSEDGAGRRCVESIQRELQVGLAGLSCAFGRSRTVTAAADLPRAAAEALLAANVAEGQEGQRALAFEETGAYRLLLSAMSESPGELRSFYQETVAPVAAYDAQYETDLVRTLSTFLEADGNVAGTAQRLYTHRHTIYYRLERIRELSGLDVSSSDGREKLSLGLKAMRVLGIAAATGPASERSGSERG